MSEKQVKRIVDVNYDNFQSLPRWRKVIQEVVKAHVLVRDPGSEGRRLRIKSNPVPQMPDKRIRVKLDPSQSVDSEELAAEIIERLRTLEMSFILEEKRKEVEEEYHRHRSRWEDSEITRRKAWEERVEAMHSEYLAEYGRDVNARRNWEIEEARKRREFELELTEDQLTRSQWEKKEGDEVRAAQKKLAWMLLLSTAAFIISTISLAL